MSARVLFANLYDRPGIAGSIGHIYASREAADAAAMPSRVKCVRILLPNTIDRGSAACSPNPKP